MEVEVAVAEWSGSALGPPRMALTRLAMALQPADTEPAPQIVTALRRSPRCLKVRRAPHASLDS